MSSIEEKTDEPFVRYIDEPPINQDLETFFNKYASIPTSELRNHLLNIREKAWNKHNYPCLGRWTFLDFSIRQSPIYNEVIDRCKNQGATVIDFGCCLGQDVRQLISDGVSIKQVRGYELDPFFVEQGYQLFRDEKFMKENQVFQSADIFDDQFLDKIEPADYVHVGSFIHLFDEQTQKDVCRRLTRLCRNAIFGRQVGSIKGQELKKLSGTEIAKMMCHSPESFQNLWNEITNGEWKVEYANLKAMDQNQNIRQMLTFVVRKIH